MVTGSFCDGSFLNPSDEIPESLLDAFQIEAFEGLLNHPRGILELSEKITEAILEAFFNHLGRIPQSFLNSSRIFFGLVAESN